MRRGTSSTRALRPPGGAGWGSAAGALLLAGVLGVMAWPTSSASPSTTPRQPHSTAAGPSFALRAKAVYPVTLDQPGPIERGMILVRGGRIVAVGRDLAVPPDLPLIDLRDEVVCPGFVSAGSSLAGRHAGPESVSGAYQAVDAFDRYEKHTLALARGTTTVHLDPGAHRLVSGLGAVVKLAGPPAERTLISAADLTITLGVFDPPQIVERPFYASADVPIKPAKLQRPDSRLGQYLELEERIAAAEEWLARAVQPGAVAPAQGEAKFDIHSDSFIEAWAAGIPLRIQVRRAMDIEGALRFIRQHDRPAYLVGLTEAHELADELMAANVPVVVRVDERYRFPAGNIGGDPDALEPRVTTAGELAAATPGLPLRLALAGAEGDPQEDPRMAALLAVRGGLSPRQALAAVTRVPAEILGVDARIGSLAPGKDADFVVLSGDPLAVSSHVRQVYVNGRVVFEAPPTDALVIKAGTVWIGDGTLLHDGAILIEKGKIQAVGHRVPHPPFARVIDAGADSFLTPGFIDAHGHLGLSGDKSVAAPDLPIHRTVAVATREFERVARAGVTTVLLAPYRSAPNGARMAAVKTYGPGRGDLVARELTGVRFSLRGKDPLLGTKPLRKALEAGKKYDETWKKYAAELAEWKEGKRKEGAAPRKDDHDEVVEEKPDPITGTWEFTLNGGPLPEPVSGTITLKLTGSAVEGRVSDPVSGEEVDVAGTFDGTTLTLEVDADTPLGKPTIVATLDREDHVVGQVRLGEFEIAFEATRVDKSPVEFRVQHKRKRTKDGRPTPPKVDEKLEPLRPLLAGKIPAVVEVETAAQIHAVLKLFVDEFKVPLVLLGPRDTANVIDELLARKDKLGVVVPERIESVRADVPYNQAADLSRRGIRVALQSDAEDGARNLPLMGLFAVQRGLGGDAALRALTIDAARMYKLDDQIGSLEPGKDADVLIFSGHPFDAGSRLERVIVAGREVPDE